GREEAFAKGVELLEREIPQFGRSFLDGPAERFLEFRRGQFCAVGGRARLLPPGFRQRTPIDPVEAEAIDQANDRLFGARILAVTDRANRPGVPAGFPSCAWV